MFCIVSHLDLLLEVERRVYVLGCGGAIKKDKSPAERDMGSGPCAAGAGRLGRA